ncbi:hypothetical protein J6500_07885 [Bradyrhizobium sp. WSM 1704]|uniref:lipopolysaccharide biosynthesis protein n=1 Tax=Bradyrhizobium semiaridum TaxID=2821404 RepID=UPI001CE2916E|nr:hypothetical protein [Bradyrhizobium semiaridum]MCA6121819.1 hypothetical protein [Bradyrhizobium semiaridum]
MPGSLGQMARRILASGTLAIFAARGATLASRLLLTVLLARTLSTDDIGYFGLMTGALPFGIVLIGLEFHNFLVREQVVASPQQRVEHIRNQGALYCCTYLVILAGVAVVLIVRPDLIGIVGWFVALLAVEHLTIEASRNLIAFKQPLAANLVLLVRGGLWVYVLGIVMMAVPAARTIETVFVAWLIGGSCGILLAIVLFRRLPWREVLWHGVDWRWIAQGLRTSVPFMVIVASVLTSAYCDRFFIDGYLQRRDVGIYTFFSMLAIGVQSLITSVSQQYLPVIIAARHESAFAHTRSLVRFAKTLVLYSMAANAAAIAAIYPVLWLIGKPDYSDNLHIFLLLLAASAFRGFADIPAHALYSAGADRELLMSNVASAVTAICLSATLTPAMGLPGAALGSVCAAIALLAAEGGFAVRRLRRRHESAARPLRS